MPHSRPPQFVCLLRHGQSLAQGTHKSERRTDVYRDCYCSPQGVNQAYAIPNCIDHHGGVGGFDLVVSSPLTRALCTALLGFRDRHLDCPMVVHPGCRELGSGIPENIPRSLKELRRDPELNSLPRFEEVDFNLLPADWPAESRHRGHGGCDGCGGGGGGGTKSKQDDKKTSSKHSKSRAAAGKSSGGERVVGGGVLEWLRAQPAQRVAVVCHHNYITSLVGGIKVENAVPIECVLDGSGIRLATPGELERALSAAPLESVGRGCGGGGSSSSSNRGGGGGGKPLGRGSSGRGPGGAGAAEEFAGREPRASQGSNKHIGPGTSVEERGCCGADGGAKSALRVFLVDKRGQKRGGVLLILPQKSEPTTLGIPETPPAVPPTPPPSAATSAPAAHAQSGGSTATTPSRAIVQTAFAKFKGLKSRVAKATPAQRKGGVVVIRRQADGRAFVCDSDGVCSSAAAASACLDWLENDDVLFVGVPSEEDLSAPNGSASSKAAESSDALNLP